MSARGVANGTALERANRPEASRPRMPDRPTDRSIATWSRHLKKTAIESEAI
ncbi:hypothetical protein Rcae01_00601 [Novipirellula caenicola]|uniref:Uncharacterized protein n=1 Tax=Novipirellula caenicola TaxID=1536901 RepID=A0ABP9VLL1_9BACT